MTTTDADWKPVADALARAGKLGDNGTAYRVALVRNDLQVTTDGVPIKPGLSLGGYAAFARYDNNQTLLMGHLVVTEAELPRVTDALQAHGIAQTGLHKHLLQQTPPVWWAHVHGMGDAVQFAQGLKAALDAMSIGPAASPPAQQPPVDIDTGGIEQALGRKGSPDGGLFKHPPRGDHRRGWARAPRGVDEPDDGHQFPARRRRPGRDQRRLHSDCPGGAKGHPGFARRQHPDRRTTQPWPHRGTPVVLHALLGGRRRCHPGQGAAPTASVGSSSAEWRCPLGGGGGSASLISSTAFLVAVRDQLRASGGSVPRSVAYQRNCAGPFRW